MSGTQTGELPELVDLVRGKDVCVLEGYFITDELTMSGVNLNILPSY